MSPDCSVGELGASFADLPLCPLSLHQLGRDVYGSFDALAIAQLAGLARDRRYQPKFYKAPDLASEVLPGNGYIDFGLAITPRSLIYGIYLPADSLMHQPKQFSLQITDSSLKHKFWDEAIPSYFAGNCNPTYLDMWKTQIACFPYLFDSAHPVVGTGLFSIEIWETTGVAQRIELVLGVLEWMGEEVLR